MNSKVTFCKALSFVILCEAKFDLQIKKNDEKIRF